MIDPARRQGKPHQSPNSSPCRTTGLGEALRVNLFARRPHDPGVRATTWITRGQPRTDHARLVEAFRESREPRRSGALLGSPFDLWINRAFRHHASGDLLIKGGAGAELSAGVAAAMTAALMLFALGQPVGSP
jgi:hypothetical protein